jgi:hypothetical protein
MPHSKSGLRTPRLDVAALGTGVKEALTDKQTWEKQEKMLAFQRHICFVSRQNENSFQKNDNFEYVLHNIIKKAFT